MELEITGAITVQGAQCVVFNIPPPGDARDGIAGDLAGLHSDLGLVRSNYRPGICALCPNYPVDDETCWSEGAGKCPVDTQEGIIRAEYVPLLQLRGLTVRSSHG